MIQKILKHCSATALTLVAGLLITGCASLEDNLTGVPIASVSHYKKGRSVREFFVNGKSAGFNSGGYSSPLSTISLDKNFKGPLVLDVKWIVCNQIHFLKDRNTKNRRCINENNESKVSVHVLNSPAESAYIYLHFFEDNTVEAWMTKSAPESKNYPGPLFPKEYY